MYINLLRVLFLLFFFSLSSGGSNKYTPIVLWHGIADSCCNNTTTGRVRQQLMNYLPGVHVVSLMIGRSSKEDYINSYIMHPDKQIQIACDIIKSDPLLADGYNAVGFSQGSQFLRGLAQRCPEPKMKTLITMAGQHQGVYGIPSCNAVTIPFCDILRRLLTKGVYLKYVQKLLVPATYWHTPLNKEMYKTKSTYLADINNERIINQSYITNLQSLQKFVMVKHEADTTVQPIESSWFGFYKPGQAKEVESLRESELYTTDQLGLKQMDIDGKLHFLSNTWRHEEFQWPWFQEHIVDKYLK